MPKMKRSEHAAAKKNAKEERENYKRRFAGQSSSRNLDIDTNLEPNPEIDKVSRKKSKKSPFNCISCSFCPQIFKQIEAYNLHYAEIHATQHGPRSNQEHSNTVKDTTENDRFENSSSNSFNTKRRRSVCFDKSNVYDYDDTDDNSDHNIPTRAKIYKKSKTSELNLNSDSSDISESSNDEHRLIDSDYNLSTRTNIYKTSNTKKSKLNKETDISEKSETSDDEHRLIDSDHDFVTQANINNNSNTTEPKLKKKANTKKLKKTKLNKETDISEISKTSDDEQSLINSDYGLSTKANIYRKSKNTDQKINKKRKSSNTKQDSDTSYSDSENNISQIFNKYAKEIHNCLSKMQKKFKSTKRIAYKCITCSLHFLEKSEWQKHLLTGIHTVNSSRCDHCLLHFTRKSMRQHLKMHEKNGKIMKKLKFQIITETNYSLSETITDTSSQSSESDEEERRKDAISKPGCSKTGTEKPATEKSYKRNDEENIKNILNDKVYVKRKYKPKLFKCNDREQHILNREAVELHRRKKCTNHKQMGKICNICTITFGDSTQLLEHQRLHHKRLSLPRLRTTNPRSKPIKIKQSRNQIAYHNRNNDSYDKEMTLYKCERCTLHFVNRKPWVAHRIANVCKNKLNAANVKECQHCKLYFTKRRTFPLHLEIHKKYPSITKSDFRIQSGKPGQFNTATVPQSNSVSTTAENCNLNTRTNEQVDEESSLNQSNCETTSITGDSCKVKLAKIPASGQNTWHIVKDKSKQSSNTSEVVSAESKNTIVPDDCRNMNQDTESVHKLSDKESNLIESTNADTVVKLLSNDVRATVDSTFNEPTNATENTKINEDCIASFRDNIIPNTSHISSNKLNESTNKNTVVNLHSVPIDNVSITVDTVTIKVRDTTESTKNNEDHISSSRDNITPSTFDNSNNKLNTERTGNVVNKANTATENTAIASHSKDSYYYSETELLHILSDNVSNLNESTQNNNHNETDSKHKMSDNESKLIESTNKAAVVDLNLLPINNVRFSVDTSNNAKNEKESTKNYEGHVSSSRDNSITSSVDNSNVKLNSKSTGHVVNTAEAATGNISIAGHTEDSTAHNKNKKYYYSETELIHILSDNKSNLIKPTQNNNLIKIESIHKLRDNESKLIGSTNKAAVVNLNSLPNNNVSFIVDTTSNNITNAQESTENNEDHVSSSQDDIIPSSFDNSGNKLNSKTTGHVVNRADTVTENMFMYVTSHSEGSNAHNKNQVNCQSETQYETFIKNERIDRAIKQEIIDKKIETNDCNPNLSIKEESKREIKIEVILEKTEINVQDRTQIKNRDCKNETNTENIEPFYHNCYAKERKYAEIIKMEKVAAEDGQVIKNENIKNKNINNEILKGEQSMQNVVKTETEDIAPKVENDIENEYNKEEIKIEYDEPAPKLENNSSTLDNIKIIEYYSLRLKLEKPNSSGSAEDATDNIDTQEIIHDNEARCDNAKCFSDEYENPQSANGELYIKNEMSSSNHEERDDMTHECDENTIFIKKERSINSTHFEQTFPKSECKSEITNKENVRVCNNNEKRRNFSELNTQNNDLDEIQDERNCKPNEELYENYNNALENNGFTSNTFIAIETNTNNETTTHAGFLCTDIFSNDNEEKGSTSNTCYFGGLNLDRNNSELIVKDEEYLTDTSHIKKEEEDEVSTRNRQPKCENQQTIEEIIISDDDDDILLLSNTVVISDDEDYFIKI